MMVEKGNHGAPSCISGNKADERRVTNLDSDIGKMAYWKLAIKKYDDHSECGDSIEMATTFVAVEKMLEKLPEQPFVDLIFVDAVSSEEFVPLKPSEHRFRESFRRILKKFVHLARKLPVECKFSPAMTLLIESIEEFKIEACLGALDGGQVRDRRGFRAEINRINRFYWSLMERVASPYVRKKIHDHAWNCEDNYRNYSSYVDSLFGAYARLVVVRLDLEYRAGVKRGLTETIRDIKKFFSNGRHNERFSGLCGYIVKVEFGICTGYHFHVLMFFDGSKRANDADAFIGDKLCEYWCKIVPGGNGRAFNVNRNKSEYAERGSLGIGTISYTDQSAIRNLKNIVRYFCKKEQFFRPVYQPKFKTIRRMAKPSWEGKKPGRPRAKEINLH